tara:strand:+ start:197 stop:520 length:324 start_codon:yes stop_codon:yes gene_type:complete
MAGQTPHRALISAVSKEVQCQITTVEAHGYSTGNHVRITDLGRVSEASNRGMVQINDKQFLIFVNSTTTFLLRDETTFDYIDSTAYDTYVSGGRVNLENYDFEYAGE